MRRIVPVVLAVVIVACDPTGNGLPVIDSADLRFANFVTDAGGMSLGTLGGNVANGITFGTTSLSSALPVGETIFTLSQTSNAFLVATDTFTLVKDRHYTIYALGQLSAGFGRLLVDDTVPATAGSFKVRFIHAVGTQSAFTLDFYADTDSSLVGLTAAYTGLGYGTAGVYVPVDTGIHRLRIVKNGTTSPVLLDTTFTDPITSGSVLTMVATNQQGGSSPLRLSIVPDTIP